MPQLIGEEEDVSVYDIADHPDFRFRTTDIVIRIGNAEDGAPHKEDEPSVGQVARVDVSSKVEVVWADNSKTIILPQVRPCQRLATWLAAVALGWEPRSVSCPHSRSRSTALRSSWQGGLLSGKRVSGNLRRRAA